MRKIEILLISLLLCSPPVSADSSAQRADIPLSKKGSSSLELFRKLSFSHSVDGYEENCGREVLIVWGKPKRISAADPQLSRITVIDVKHKSIARKLDISGGIFGARFLRNGKFAYLEANPEILLDLSNGASQAINESTYNTFDFEDCNNSPGKSYLKYAK